MSSTYKNRSLNSHTAHYNFKNLLGKLWCENRWGRRKCRRRPKCVYFSAFLRPGTFLRLFKAYFSFGLTHISILSTFTQQLKPAHQCSAGSGRWFIEPNFSQKGVHFSLVGYANKQKFHTCGPKNHQLIELYGPLVCSLVCSFDWLWL